MKKKVLVIALAFAMLALPMVSAVQAWGWNPPSEVYDDLLVGGMIYPDEPVEVTVRTWRNIQWGRYTANAPFVFIGWDFPEGGGPTEHFLIGSGEYSICYTINTNTGKGVVHLKTVTTIGAPFPAGTFEGSMFWIGDLSLLEDDTVDLNDAGNWNWYTYWRGTGAYEGWTITQNFDETWTMDNYLIIR